MGKNDQTSRFSRKRALSLTAVYVFFGAHVLHWALAGRTLAPLEFNEVLHTLHLGIVTAGFLFMAVTVVSTALVGRFFCGWACHILALEDLCAWLLARIGIRPTPIRSRFWLWIPILSMAYLFIWPHVGRLLEGSPMPALQIVSASGYWSSFSTTDFWRNLPGPGITLLTLAICGFAIVYLLGSRSFCRYVCPYGAIFAAVDKAAPGRIIMTGDCQQCGTCTIVCKSDILVHREIEQFGAVVSHDCLKDLDCVGECPQNAISFGFTRPPLVRGWAWLRGVQRTFNFSWRTDVVLALTFFVTLMVFRGLYDAIPLLLALTLAVLCGFLLVKNIKLWTRPHSRLNKVALRKAGHLTVFGRLFAGLSVLVAVFVLHSAFVQYHTLRGQSVFDNQADLGLIVVETAQTDLGDAQRGRALGHLETAYRWGIFKSARLRRQMAFLYEASGSMDMAEQQLRAFVDDQPDNMGGRFYLGKLLLKTDRAGEGADFLNQLTVDAGDNPSARSSEIAGASHTILGHHALKSGKTALAINHFRSALIAGLENAPTLITLGALLAGEDLLQEARDCFSRALNLDPGSAAAHNNLAVVLEKSGDNQTAMRHYRLALGLEPDSPRTLFNMGNLHMHEGRRDSAATYFRKALILRPDYPEARLGLKKAMN